MKGLPVSEAAPRFQLGCSVGLLVFQSLGLRRSVFIPLPDTGLGWTFLISLLPAQTGGRAGRQTEGKSFLYPEKGFSCPFFCQPWAWLKGGRCPINDDGRREGGGGLAHASWGHAPLSRARHHQAPCPSGPLLIPKCP